MTLAIVRQALNLEEASVVVQMRPLGDQRPYQLDVPLLVAVVVIATLGVVNLYSATSVYIGAGARAGLADIYVSQIYWLVVGFLLAVLVTVIDYRHFERLAMVLYSMGLLQLGLVFVLAKSVRGSARWLQLGSFTFQPSEFMKILLILALARHLHNDSKTETKSGVDLLVPLGLTIVPIVAVMAQPDFGTSMLYLLTALTILFLLRIRRSTLVTLLAAAGAAIPILWNYILLDYQKARVTSFLQPDDDRSGAGWHAFQSKTAIGNGGVFGEGFMQGIQNQFGFLPDQYSDFPFSVYAEDWGFLGGLVLLGLYCFVSIWSVHIASQAKDRFGAVVAIGVGAMIFWHTVFNLGMALGVLPVVGITLPLFSYGGSSMITMLIGFGLLMNVSIRR